MTTTDRRVDAPGEDADEESVLVAARLHAHQAFAAHTRPGRNAVWWAMVIGLVGIGTIASAFVYSYFYLRLGADTWPPDGTALRPLGFPLVALALLVVAAGVGPGGDRARWRLALSGGFGLIAGVVQVASLVDSDYDIAGNAYEALVVTMDSLAAIVLASAILVRVFAVVHHRTAPRPGALLDADTALWWGATGIWVGLWLVVHVAPRIV